MEKPKPKTLGDFKFKSLDPDEVMEALKGQVDVLTPAVEAQSKRLQNQTCPMCGEAIIPVLHPQPFANGRTLPRYIGKCSGCKAPGILIDA